MPIKRAICTAGQLFERNIRRCPMKKTWMWCLVALLSLGSLAWSQDKQADTEKTVAALEQQWLQSEKTNNPDLVAPLLADKFISTDPDGKSHRKSEFLANEKASKYDR